jgi:hypothetical protein
LIKGMTIEEAIKKAYPNQKEMFSPTWGKERYFLLPDFWQSLGKALGWILEGHAGRKQWKEEWHRLIDHLAEGKTAESFFESLK